MSSDVKKKKLILFFKITAFHVGRELLKFLNNINRYTVVVELLIQIFIYYYFRFCVKRSMVLLFYNDVCFFIFLQKSSDDLLDMSLRCYSKLLCIWLVDYYLIRFFFEFLSSSFKPKL